MGFSMYFLPRAKEGKRERNEIVSISLSLVRGNREINEIISISPLLCEGEIERNEILYFFSLV
jgi:hypothetical protein